MKIYIVLSAIVPGILASIFARAACNADNCARAVTPSVYGTSVSLSRRQDCSSFQTATTYPPASTTTITSGSTSTTIIAVTADTVIKPSSLPTYAQTACTPAASVASRFASACSCAGVKTDTITAPTPVATVIVPPSLAYRKCPIGSNSSPGIGYQLCTGNGGCYCFQNADGINNYCAVSSGCGKGCSTNADCNTGDVCSIKTGCGVAGSCLPTFAFQACVNPGATRRLFRKALSGWSGPPPSD